MNARKLRNPKFRRETVRLHNKTKKLRNMKKKNYPSLACTFFSILISACSHLLQFCPHGSRLTKKEQLQLQSQNRNQIRSQIFHQSWLISSVTPPILDTDCHIPSPHAIPADHHGLDQAAAFFSSTASVREHASKINGKWEEACICPPLPLIASVVHPLGECASKSMQASVLHPNYLLDTLLQKWHRKIYNGHTFTKNHIYPHKVTMYPYGFAYSNAWAYLSKAQVTCHNQLYDMLHILRMMSDEDKLQQN